MKHSPFQPKIIIAGPTASGKTKLAVALARHLDGEIISADSRQVYRGLDLVSGKDLKEYGEVPYHGINLLEISQEYSASRFQLWARAWISSIEGRGKVAILCGGTGHYLKALIQDYPFAHPGHNPHFSHFLESLPLPFLTQVAGELKLSGPTDSKRRIARQIEKALSPQVPSPAAPPDWQFQVFLLKVDRTLLRTRILSRLKERFEQGMIGEVEGILNQGVPADRLLSLGLEYKWITRYLLGEINREELELGLYQAICQFAKRQETFFRYMQKEGIAMQPVESLEQMLERLKK